MEPDARIDLLPLDLRADVRPDSLDEGDRSFEVIFSTGAPVSRIDWLTGQRYVETLSMKPKHIQLDRLNDGAPFLNAHQGDDLVNQIGVVVDASARVQDGKGYARIRMVQHDADADRIWNKIRQRIVRNISVGYRVHKYEKTEGQDGEPMQLHAVDWEPYEVSAVPMPADNGAKVRAPHETYPCVIITRAAEETTMAEVPVSVDRLMDPQPPTHPPIKLELEEELTPSQADLGATEERKRITGILRACEAARLSMARAEKYIADKTSLLDAQSDIFESLRANPIVNGRQPVSEIPSGVAFVGADPLENVWKGVLNALLHKAAPQYFPLEDIGRPYRSRSLLASAEMCLHARHPSLRTHDMSKDTLAGVALGLTQVRHSMGAYHTTSDFANLLADASNKILRAAYEEAPQTFAPISRRIPIPDFKTVNVAQFGAAPALLEVREDGEFQSGTIGEGKETFALATYGRIFGISRKALVNDDLDAFSSVPIKFGRAARNKESDLVWAQITTNPLMSDSIALFAAGAAPTGHGNLTTGPGTVISITSLGVGFASMRVQKDIDNLTPLNLTPTYLIVPVAQEGLARQFTAAINPQTGTAVNPYASFLTVITEPRLDATSSTAWYLASSTAQTDMVLYGFLDGQEGPTVESQVGWRVDGLEIKCRHDVAAKVVDFRGLYKNVGA